MALEDPAFESAGASTHDSSSRMDVRFQILQLRLVVISESLFEVELSIKGKVGQLHVVVIHWRIHSILLKLNVAHLSYIRETSI